MKYICPADCIYSLGEDGCVNSVVDEAIGEGKIEGFEKDGDYPICPAYKDHEEQIVRPK